MKSDRSFKMNFNVCKHFGKKIVIKNQNNII